MSITKLIRSTKNNERLLPILDKVIAEHYNKHDMKHVNIHPSQLGGCLRKQLLGMLNCAKDGFDSQTLRKFHNGNHVHERIQEYIQLAKRYGRIKDCVFEEEVRAVDSPDPKVKKLTNIAAKFDCIVTFLDRTQALVEIKSMYSKSYYKPDIHITYIYQAEMYMMLKGFKEVLMIKECKDDQTWKEHVVKSDPKIKKDCFARILAINTHLANKTLPEKICPSIRSDGAKGCTCRTPCFSLLNDWGNLELITSATPVKKFFYEKDDKFIGGYGDKVREVVLRKLIESCMRDTSEADNFIIPSAGLTKNKMKDLVADVRQEKRLFDVEVKWM